ncbi:MAG: DegT/DnrJ/EryC1/StrS family aminotransferase [Alphaproteobacteria bacterium]
MTDQKQISFVDLGAQYEAHKPAIDSAIQTVLNHGKFIMGPEIGEFESWLCKFTGAGNAISCSSGTDALLMILMAEGIGPGDAVFVPAFTFTATAEVLLMLGATTVFVDVDGDDFNMDMEDLNRQISITKSKNELKARGILAVDLFGLPADYKALKSVAEQHGMKVWADAAQSLGGSYHGRMVGSLGRATAVSFFPAKPLGCYGDGGAVLCDDDEMADVMRSIRAHGKGGAKYDIVRIGLNARLDTIQAAILLAKAPGFHDEIKKREEVALAYDRHLSNIVKTPTRREGRTSAWAQYTIQVPETERDGIVGKLKELGVPSAVYYPKPMHMQSAYKQYGQGEGSLPASESLSKRVLSLPMHPFLPDSHIDRIVEAVTDAVS